MPVRSGDVPIELEALGRVSAYNAVTARALARDQVQLGSTTVTATFAARDLLVQARLDRLQSLVKLYAALGGEWTPASAAPAAMADAAIAHGP